MTEAEWLACGDPQRMLDFLREVYKPLSGRKLRLFGVICCRSVLRSEGEEELERAIEFAERCADAWASSEDWDSAYREVFEEWFYHFGNDSVVNAVYCFLSTQEAFEAAVWTALNAAEAAHFLEGHGTRESESL